MFKKIFLILFCAIVFFSCGKKGDPKYQVQNIQLIKNKII